jgi:hypothetical protein
MTKYFKTIALITSLSAGCAFAATSEVINVPTGVDSNATQSGAPFPQDQGPNKIDVNAYPAQQQAGYKLFASKCSKCHTLARPINTSMTRDQWDRSVKRMMHMPNSGISASQGEQTVNFLAYDQSERKDKAPNSFLLSKNSN